MGVSVARLFLDFHSFRSIFTQIYDIAIAIITSAYHFHKTSVTQNPSIEIAAG